MTNKIVIFGNTIYTKIIIDFFLRKKFNITLITIDSKKAKKNNVFNFFNLNIYKKNNLIEIYCAKNFNLKNEKDIVFFKNLKPKIGFVNGWQRLIPKKILQNFTIGVFGMHGSSMSLPKGRGRSPLNWSIIERRKKFITNIFKYSPGIDDGDILDSCKFDILPSDTCNTLHIKNSIGMRYLIKKNLKNLINNTFLLKKQSKTKPTFYPSRKPSDSEINWLNKIENIFAHINAVTKPFNGAFGFINSSKIVIWKSNIFLKKNLIGFKNSKVGEVVDIIQNKPLIKCTNGILILEEYNSKKSIKIGDHFEIRKVKKFKKNKYGFYDI